MEIYSQFLSNDGPIRVKIQYGIKLKGSADYDESRKIWNLLMELNQYYEIYVIILQNLTK